MYHIQTEENQRQWEKILTKQNKKPYLQRNSTRVKRVTADFSSEAM